MNNHVQVRRSLKAFLYLMDRFNSRQCSYFPVFAKSVSVAVYYIGQCGQQTESIVSAAPAHSSQAPRIICHLKLKHVPSPPQVGMKTFICSIYLDVMLN
jgi:hypothetical protein